MTAPDWPRCQGEPPRNDCDPAFWTDGFSVFWDRRRRSWTSQRERRCDACRALWLLD